MLDDCRLATKSDLENAWQLYVDVCAQMPFDRYSPKWTIGVFPTKADVRGYLEAGQLYLGLIDGRVAGAFALTPHEDEQYLGMDWPSGATGSEVAVVHLLCGHPSFRSRGVGRSLMEHALAAARGLGKRAVHLDVVSGNLAASRIYLEAGFVLAGTKEIHYEDTGTIAFELYEHAFS